MANLWLPETLISLLFEFIAKGKFSSGNINWLEYKIQEATPELSESQLLESLNLGFRRLLGIKRSHGFEILEERPDAVVISYSRPDVKIIDQMPSSSIQMPASSSSMITTINGHAIDILDKYFESRLR